MKLLYFSDSHIRGSSPKSRTDDYPETLWKKFQQLTGYINTYHIDAVLNGGDLFDTPDPATGVVNRYLELFKSWSIPIYSIVGSHDKFGYNDATIGRTALGTLIAAGVVQLVSDPIHIGDNTSVCGTSHSYSLDQCPEIDYYYKKSNDDFLIQMCHGMITEVPFFGKYTIYSTLETEADLILCGHYHPGFGPYRIDDSTIINIGSMGRVENVKRKYAPGFLSIDTAMRSFNFHKFDTEESPFVSKDVVDQTLVQDMVQFIETLKTKVGDLEKADLHSLIISLGKEQKLPQCIIDKALGYIKDERL